LIELGLLGPLAGAAETTADEEDLTINSHMLV